MNSSISSLVRLVLAAAGLTLLSSCAVTTTESDNSVTRQQYWPAPPDTPRYRHVMTFRSSNDFVQSSTDDRVREMLLGKSAPQYVIKRPLDLAGSNGVLYLIDTDSPVIHVLDLVKRRYSKFGYRFEGKLERPVGIAVGKDGKVYVADRGRNCVIVYDSIGLYQKLFNLDGVTTQLAGLTLDREGEYLYLVDRGGIDSRRHQVVKMDLEGNVLQQIGQRGKEQGDFNLPTDIAVGQDGYLYVLDSGNFRVQVLDPSGNLVRVWGRVGNALGQFGQPRAIAIDADNHVYVSDAQFGNVQIFDADGRLLLPIGGLAREDAPGRYALITGINIDSRNHLYVLDQHLGKIEIFSKLTVEQQQKALAEHKASDS